MNAGQHIEGKLVMDANNLQSYYVKLTMGIKGTDVKVEAPCIDLMPQADDKINSSRGC